MVKRTPVKAAATLALITTCVFAPSRNFAQETILMPEVKVSDQREVLQHPQDGNYSHPPLGCVEIVTPAGTGNELGGHFQGRFARDGIPVMPNLNDPTSAADYWRRGPTNEQSTATPPGREGKAGCAR